MCINKCKFIYMYKYRIWESLGKFLDLWLLIFVVYIDFLFGYIYNFKFCWILNYIIESNVFVIKCKNNFRLSYI